MLNNKYKILIGISFAISLSVALLYMFIEWEVIKLKSQQENRVINYQVSDIKTVDSIFYAPGNGNNVIQAGRVDALVVGRDSIDARVTIDNNANKNEDLLRLYAQNSDLGPAWRWNDGGHAIVRTSLAITGDHTLSILGGYSSMLAVRSDLPEGVPAVIIQTNHADEGSFRGPLILGLDWDDIPTISLRPEGDIQTTGMFTTLMSGKNVTDKQTAYAALVGPEVGIYIRGTGNLDNGRAVISLPDHFRKSAAEGTVTVHLTPEGEWLQLFVREKSTEKIIVEEAEGKSGIFSYVIYGVRSGYENYQPLSTYKTEKNIGSLRRALEVLF